ncbi:universal stress protein [Rhodobacteraceae bacterium XHP0102]|nr:universal stress protein [Rhodobacteraceae bacterium XHP0102]
MTDKPILMALVDASAYSESLCHYAAWMAQRSDWKVKIYHSLARQGGTSQGDYSGQIRLGARSRLLAQLADMDEARAKLAVEQGRAVLEDAAALIRAEGVEVETRLRHGDLLETVAEKEAAAQMILIGKRGEAASQAMAHLGSNLGRILRAAQKPVFIANRRFAPIHKVLIAFDGGVSAKKAVDYIAAAPAFAGLSVTLVFAGTPSDTQKSAITAAEAQLNKAGISADILIEAGEPERLLSRLCDADATSNNAHDLLVMGAYGHSRVRHLMVGSTTTQMIQSCKSPILVMR